MASLLVRTHTQALPTIEGGQALVWPWAFLAAGTAGLLVGAAFFTAAVTETRIDLLLRDPNAIAGQPFYYGALEMAGIVLMACTAGATLLAASLCAGRTLRFLLMGGLLTMLLVGDDLYMLHENSPIVGLNETITFGLYGALALAFCIVNLRFLLDSSLSLFVASGVFFAAAIASDAIPGFARLLPSGSEDILEVIGICYWSAFFIKCSRDALLSTHGADAAAA